jgi:phospholipid transport system substrate-binding protein
MVHFSISNGRPVRTLALAAVLALSAAGLSCGAPAQAGESPTVVVSTLDRSLLSVMKNADKLGYDGRYAALEPIVAQTFDLPFMTRVAVGSTWNSLTSEQQLGLTDAFRRFITATYAHRFDGYSGERFDTKGEQPGSGGVVVATELVRPNDGPVALNYLTRQINGDWRVVDVFLTGTISELAQRRSEFASVLRRDGYDGLKALLESKVVQLASAAAP